MLCGERGGGENVELNAAHADSDGSVLMLLSPNDNVKINTAIEKTDSKQK